MPMITDETEVDHDFIKRIMSAQLRHVRAMCDDESIDHATWSDDGYDYLKGALALGRDLLEICFDNDVRAFRNLFNPLAPEFIPVNYATDGICEPIWEYIPEEWYDLVPKPTSKLWPAASHADDDLD